MNSRTLVNNTMNQDNDFDTMSPFCVRIFNDTKMAKALEDHYGKEFIAFKSPEFGFGVFVANDLTSGVYADDSLRKAAISVYWDLNHEAIKEALNEAECVDDVCEIMHEILLGCITDIMECKAA